MPNCQIVRLVRFLFERSYGYFSLLKSPFGLAKPNCRRWNIKEVRGGPPSSVAVTGRAQRLHTHLEGAVHSLGWGFSKRAHSALADKEACFLFPSGQET